VKLLNIDNMHVNILQKKMCGPHIRLCLCTFLFIASKQIKNLTVTITIIWLDGVWVTHQVWVREVPGLIPGFAKGFYVWFIVLLLLCFYCFVQNTAFVTTVCNFFCNVNAFSTYTYCNFCDRLYGYKDTGQGSLSDCVWVKKELHASLGLMYSFNKTKAAIFPCRLCFLKAFPFLNLI